MYYTCKKSIKTISIAILIAFSINTCAYGLAPLPASQNPLVKRNIYSVLARTQVLSAVSDDAQDLLAANNAACLLLSNGKYLVNQDLADKFNQLITDEEYNRDPATIIKVLSLIKHEDIEALMQILSRQDRRQYNRIKERVLEAFPPTEENVNKLFSLNEKKDNLTYDTYVNHLVAKAFQWFALIEEGMIYVDEIPEEEKPFFNEFKEKIEPQKTGLFTKEFWNPYHRSERIRKAVAGGMVFYQVAHEEAQEEAPQAQQEAVPQNAVPSLQEIDNRYKGDYIRHHAGRARRIADLYVKAIHLLPASVQEISGIHLSEDMLERLSYRARYAAALHDFGGPGIPISKTREDEIRTKLNAFNEEQGEEVIPIPDKDKGGNSPDIEQYERIRETVQQHGLRIKVDQDDIDYAFDRYQGPASLHAISQNRELFIGCEPLTISQKLAILYHHHIGDLFMAIRPAGEPNPNVIRVFEKNLAKLLLENRQIDTTEMEDEEVTNLLEEIKKTDFTDAMKKETLLIASILVASDVAENGINYFKKKFFRNGLPVETNGEVMNWTDKDIPRESAPLINNAFALIGGDVPLAEYLLQEPSVAENMKRVINEIEEEISNTEDKRSKKKMEEGLKLKMVQFIKKNPQSRLTELISQNSNFSQLTAERNVHDLKLALTLADLLSKDKSLAKAAGELNTEFGKIKKDAGKDELSEQELENLRTNQLLPYERVGTTEIYKLYRGDIKKYPNAPIKHDYALRHAKRVEDIAALLIEGVRSRQSEHELGIEINEETISKIKFAAAAHDVGAPEFPINPRKVNALRSELEKSLDLVQADAGIKEEKRIKLPEKKSASRNDYETIMGWAQKTHNFFGQGKMGEDYVKDLFRGPVSLMRLEAEIGISLKDNYITRSQRAAIQFYHNISELPTYIEEEIKRINEKNRAIARGEQKGVLENEWDDEEVRETLLIASVLVAADSIEKGMNIFKRYFFDAKRSIELPQQTRWFLKHKSGIPDPYNGAIRETFTHIARISNEEQGDSPDDPEQNTDQTQEAGPMDSAQDRFYAIRATASRMSDNEIGTLKHEELLTGKVSEEVRAEPGFRHAGSYAEKHAELTREIARLFALQLGLSGPMVHKITQVSFVHNIKAPVDPKRHLIQQAAGIVSRIQKEYSDGINSKLEPKGVGMGGQYSHHVQQQNAMNRAIREVNANSSLEYITEEEQNFANSQYRGLTTVDFLIQDCGVPEDMFSRAQWEVIRMQDHIGELQDKMDQENWPEEDRKEAALIAYVFKASHHVANQISLFTNLYYYNKPETKKPEEIIHGLENELQQHMPEEYSKMLIAAFEGIMSSPTSIEDFNNRWEEGQVLSEEEDDALKKIGRISYAKVNLPDLYRNYYTSDYARRHARRTAEIVTLLAEVINSHNGNIAVTEQVLKKANFAAAAHDLGAPDEPIAPEWIDTRMVERKGKEVEEKGLHDQLNEILRENNFAEVQRKIQSADMARYEKLYKFFFKTNAHEFTTPEKKKVRNYMVDLFRGPASLMALQEKGISVDYLTRSQRFAIQYYHNISRLEQFLNTEATDWYPHEKSECLLIASLLVASDIIERGMNYFKKRYFEDAVSVETPEETYEKWLKTSNIPEPYMAPILAAFESITKGSNAVIGDDFRDLQEDAMYISGGERANLGAINRPIHHKDAQTNLSKGDIDELQETHSALEKTANEGRMFAITNFQVQDIDLTKISDNIFAGLLVENLYDLEDVKATKKLILEKLKNKDFKKNLIRGFNLMHQALEDNNTPVRLSIIIEEDGTPSIVYKNINENLLAHSGKGQKTGTGVVSIYAGYNALEYAIMTESEDAFREIIAHEERDIVRGHHEDDLTQKAQDCYKHALNYYDTTSFTRLFLESSSSGILDERTYEIRYDTARLSQDQQDIIKLYVAQLEKKAPKTEFVLKPFRGRGDERGLISVTCTGEDFIGTGKVDVAIPEGEISKYVLRITGMLNIAMAESNMPQEITEEQAKNEYGHILGFIKNQCASILGVNIDIPETLEGLRGVIRNLPIPDAYKLPNRITEYNELARKALIAA